MAKPTIIQVVKSVISAAIGVQSDENRKNDFTEGASLSTYVIAGVIFTVLFVSIIIFVVSLVI